MNLGSETLTYAPIIIFCYRRPDHLTQTLTSLKRCDGFEKSPIIVYADGPQNAEEVVPVEETRKVAKALLGNRAEYHFNQLNQGLARSITTGVSEVVKQFGRVIVLEDDLILSKNFLVFMNEALDAYALNECVFQISGYMFDAPQIAGDTSAVFLPFTSSWGWATWQRAWEIFEPDSPGWHELLVDRGIRRRFDIDNTYAFSTMLVRQMLGYRDSWAVRWCWSVFRRNGLVLYPPVSLVSNTGFDGSGTHGGGALRNFSAPKSSVARIELPSIVAIDQSSFDDVKRALWRHNGRWLGQWIDCWRWWKTQRLAKQADLRHLHQ